MKNFIINVFAVIVGLFVGATVNGALINISGSIIPPPEGFDLTTEEGLKGAMKIMEPKHFLMPFLAHAFGTLIGAFLTALIAVTNKIRLALLIGLAFFIGGTLMVIMLPSPLWFTVVDLGFAYIPMAYIGARLALRSKEK
jgi:hypothetical protein